MNSETCQKRGATAPDLWSQFNPEWHASYPFLCAGNCCIHCEVRQPYRPWDTLYMKMLFVAN
jgi:hypothetical protein